MDESKIVTNEAGGAVAFVGPDATYRHVRHGSIYEVVGRAKMQVSASTLNPRDPHPIIRRRL